MSGALQIRREEAGDRAAVHAVNTAAFLIRPDLFQGYIRTAQEWIFIDPLRKYDRSSAPSAIDLFDEAAVRPEAAGLCGTGGLIHGTL